MQGQGHGICPIFTTESKGIENRAGAHSGPIKAYKLGSNRFSYNEIELSVVEKGGTRSLSVNCIKSVKEMQVSHGPFSQVFMMISGSVGAQIHVPCAIRPPAGWESWSRGACPAFQHPRYQISSISLQRRGI